MYNKTKTKSKPTNNDENVLNMLNTSLEKQRKYQRKEFISWSGGGVGERGGRGREFFPFKVGLLRNDYKN